MQDSFNNKISKNIPEESHILLAVSGGIDSVVLMHLCSKISTNYKISIAHVNHNFHNDSEKMEITNRPDINEFLKRSPREGWTYNF